jgi:putative Mg2+ transporter-C (MgtC) family protein
MGEWTQAAKLLLAGLLSGIVGIERERANRPAGFRTHVLVGVGSTLVMLVSVAMASVTVHPADPARIAAQVVSGIGFLGAGTIMREGVSIRGLTTAASLWVVAGIGLATGAGLYFEAIMTTLIALLALVALGTVETRLLSHRLSSISVVIDDKPGQIGQVATYLGSRRVNIKNIEINDLEGEERLAVRFYVRMPSGVSSVQLVQEIATLPGVHSVHEG